MSQINPNLQFTDCQAQPSNNPPVAWDPKRPHVYYFASPYSSSHIYTSEMRYTKALIAAGELHNRGYCLIEPIGMSHHTAKVCNLPTGYEHWKTRDRAFIDHSDGLIVLTIEGWFQSVGVTDELQYAFATGKPVWMYETDFKGVSRFTVLDKETFIQIKASAVKSD